MPPYSCPSWSSLCIQSCMEYFTGDSTGASCTAVLLPYSYSEYCFVFFPFFSPLRGPKEGFFVISVISEPNDNSFVVLFCRSVFFNSILKAFKTTSDSVKLFIRESFCSFMLLLFFVLPAF